MHIKEFSGQITVNGRKWDFTYDSNTLKLHLPDVSAEQVVGIVQEMEGDSLGRVVAITTASKPTNNVYPVDPGPNTKLAHPELIEIHPVLENRKSGAGGASILSGSGERETALPVNLRELAEQEPGRPEVAPISIQEAAKDPWDLAGGTRKLPDIDEVGKLNTLSDIIAYLQTNGWTTEGEIVDACKAMKDKVPTLKRATNMETRISSILSNRSP